ncbi:Ypt/Rab-GAP domain of gyp1p superfamily protein isoform 3 [Hibiscus syriacus]|uniref:Ypt/Rab-GAP domain of gyp1p superfamily protein isoform 3 n=1 Tax=Hibiscus syriacus TaxID=106335 RepID=A0A6A2WA06_HIBSY|nr:ecotropic viral integration site 5 protein homolog isoform X2 [Hibiscus syriacus]KAE8653681.1 Ypt/Rab-GAP domain of gyp1p superfamily protein isoform 3 [Hibiscus syriacus]
MRSSASTAISTTTNAVNPLITFDLNRDAYGFAVRPQHVQRYREYANIYKEEEEERSDRWSDFLDRQAESAQFPCEGIPSKEGKEVSHAEAAEDGNNEMQKGAEGDDLYEKKSGSDSISENNTEKEKVRSEPEKRVHLIQIWTEIRPSLRAIDDLMSIRVKKKDSSSKDERETDRGKPLAPTEDARFLKGASEEDSEDEFYDAERSDSIQDSPTSDSGSTTISAAAVDAASIESLFPWKEELEVLVRGGVPMALRGELWQTFVGVRTLRLQNYYQDLLANENNFGNNTEQQSFSSDCKGSAIESICGPEKWKGQIEKDLPRTFPGHPALDDDGRNALRRLLTAYARHNPSVGYCQAMNFFAALLLLLMPEENAFWTLVGIIDDYFDGYYSEEMIESQVDQLVFEELMRERFPKLVNHLDYLGVHVAWVTGPWFLSIFMNMLPWESVLRVWDVLLFEGNRVMLFRTALAVMELYGPALVTTKDAGDAVTLLQSLAGSTFDSSQLVLTACMGYQNVNEKRLQELRERHRSAVITSVEERSKGLQAWKDFQGLASKLYNFNHDPKSMLMETNRTGQLVDLQTNVDLSSSESGSMNEDKVLSSLTGNAELDAIPDLQEQVVWLKVELCKLLEEKRSAVLRSEELETALMEMVKQDNRRQLSARVEQLEQEVAELRNALSEKQEQENAMLQVLMRVEQEQRVTEDARRFAEQDAAAQRYTAQVLQEKYEEAVASLAEMEKKVVMAESMLEATLQYQSGQSKVQPSPRSPHLNSPARSNQEPQQEIPARKISLLSRPFGLGWRDRNKGQPGNADAPNNGKPSNVDQNTEIQQKDTIDKETNGKETNDEETDRIEVQDKA